MTTAHTFKAGDKVHYLTEWMDEGVADTWERYCIDDEEQGRVTIRTICPGFTINPTSVQPVSRIKLA